MCRCVCLFATRQGEYVIDDQGNFDDSIRGFLMDDGCMVGRKDRRGGSWAF